MFLKEFFVMFILKKSADDKNNQHFSYNQRVELASPSGLFNYGYQSTTMVMSFKLVSYFFLFHTVRLFHLFNDHILGMVHYTYMYQIIIFQHFSFYEQLKFHAQLN